MYPKPVWITGSLSRAVVSKKEKPDRLLQASGKTRKPILRNGWKSFRISTIGRLTFPVAATYIRRT